MHYRRRLKLLVCFFFLPGTSASTSTSFHSRSALYRLLLLHLPFNLQPPIFLIFRRFRKLRKEDISFVMTLLRLSICPQGTTQFPLNDFHEIWYLKFFRKSVEKIQASLNLKKKNNGCFTWKLVYIYDNIALDSSSKSEHNFMLNSLFQKILPFMRKCRIIW
jgi:hypothetical protein